MRTTKPLTVAVALALVFSTVSIGGPAAMLCSVAHGRTVVFFDDFNDGDATDGMPGTWLPVGEPNGTFDASSGDFELSGSVSELMVARLQELDGLRDVSIRTQLRFTGPTGNLDPAVVWARGTPAPPLSYGGGINNQGDIFIVHNREVLALIPTALDPINRDVLLQFDVIGDRLSLTAWQEGELMPASPQLVTTHTALSEGPVGLSYRPNFSGGDALGSAVFRFYEVAAVPEPATGWLLLIGATLITCHTKRRHRCAGDFASITDSNRASSFWP